MLGFVGGSGLYDMEALKNPRWEKISSSFGTPSDELLFGQINGLDVVFFPRHGRGHKIAPSAINYRANIDALKRAGVTHLLSLSACGSFREELPPGAFCLVDQFIDWTVARERTFFDEGVVAHVSLAHPTCDGLGGLVLQAAANAGVPTRQGGTYVAIEGPQFSTKAESHMFRALGGDVIGMTNMPEARLAREAEIHYATLAMVTDFDCWHEDEEAVTVTNVLAVLGENARKAQKVVVELAGLFREAGSFACDTGCDRALDGAVISSTTDCGPAIREKLAAVAGRVLP